MTTMKWDPLHSENGSGLVPVADTANNYQNPQAYRDDPDWCGSCKMAPCQVQTGIYCCHELVTYGTCKHEWLCYLCEDSTPAHYQCATCGKNICSYHASVKSNNLGSLESLERLPQEMWPDASTPGAFLCDVCTMP